MSTAVFVHGVPDTAHAWDDVLTHLAGSDSRIVTLRLPGFASPLPEGFTATKEAYVQWLIERLEEFDEPVDLVGHDWGCILVARVASLRPDLIRTWAAGSGPVSADYQWHAWAEIWQTPVAGEQWMAQLDPEAFAADLIAFDVPPERAHETAGRMDTTLKASILALYRSAVTVGAEWEPGLGGASAPGLVFWGEHDPACPVRFAHELGAATSAERVEVLDCGHWTILEKPAEVAALLKEHWRR